MAEAPRFRNTTAISGRYAGETGVAGEAGVQTARAGISRAQRLFGLAAEVQTERSRAAGAEEAAAFEVRDASGQLQPMPRESADTVFGRSFNAAMETRYLANLDSDTRTALNQFALDNPLDVEAFQAQVNGYLEGMSALPEPIRGVAKDAATGYAAQLQNGIATNVAQRQRIDARASIDEQIRTVSNDMAANLVAGRVDEAYIQSRMLDELIEGQYADGLIDAEERDTRALGIEATFDQARILHDLQGFDLSLPGPGGLGGALKRIDEYATSPEMVAKYGYEPVQQLARAWRQAVTQQSKALMMVRTAAEDEQVALHQFELNMMVLDQIGRDPALAPLVQQQRTAIRDTGDPVLRARLAQQARVSLTQLSSWERLHVSDQMRTIDGWYRLELAGSGRSPELEDLVGRVNDVVDDDRDRMLRNLSVHFTGALAQITREKRDLAEGVGVVNDFMAQGRSTRSMSNKDRKRFEEMTVMQLDRAGVPAAETYRQIAAGNPRVVGSLIEHFKDLPLAVEGKINAAAAGSPEGLEFLQNVMPALTSYRDRYGESAFNSITARLNDNASGLVRGIANDMMYGISFEQALEKRQSSVTMNTPRQNWSTALDKDGRDTAMEGLPSDVALNETAVKFYQEAYGALMNYPEWRDDPESAQERAWMATRKNLRLGNDPMNGGFWQMNDISMRYYPEAGQGLTGELGAHPDRVAVKGMVEQFVGARAYIRDRQGNLVALNERDWQMAGGSVVQRVDPATPMRGVTPFGTPIVPPVELQAARTRDLLSRDYTITVGSGRDVGGRTLFPLRVTSARETYHARPLLDASGNELLLDIDGEYLAYKNRASRAGDRTADAVDLLTRMAPTELDDYLDLLNDPTRAPPLAMGAVQ